MTKTVAVAMASDEPPVVVLVYCLGAEMASPTQETCVLECVKHLAKSSTVGRIAAGGTSQLHVVAWFPLSPALVLQRVPLASCLVREVKI